MGGLCEGEFTRSRSRDDPLTLTRCHICELTQLYEALEGWKFSVGKPTTEGHKGENFFLFLSFSFTGLLLSLISWPDAC